MLVPVAGCVLGVLVREEDQATTAAVATMPSATTMSDHMGHGRRRGAHALAWWPSGRRGYWMVGGAAMNPMPHQCPFCELRFDTLHEVQDHILHEHPVEAKLAETSHVVELPPYRT
jgi:hypothetical protein